MKLYHGSSLGGLAELKPALSEHGRPYVYLATNPVVALLYAVKPVPKPFSFYPYGFDAQGAVVYSEYWENAFSALYQGKTGYLYTCERINPRQNPTEINCAYTCETPVKVDGCLEIADVYEQFIRFAREGRFRLKPYTKISHQELNMVHDELLLTIRKYRLKDDPAHPMSRFIQEHFLPLWLQAGGQTP